MKIKEGLTVNSLSDKKGMDWNFYVLWCVGPLLGNDYERSSCTTAIAK